MCVRWTHVYFWKNFARVRRKKVSKPERKLKADKKWLLNIDEKMENVGHTFSRNCALFKSETSFRPRKRLIRAILHTNERFHRFEATFYLGWLTPVFPRPDLHYRSSTVPRLDGKRWSSFLSYDEQQKIHFPLIRPRFPSSHANKL